MISNVLLCGYRKLQIEKTQINLKIEKPLYIFVYFRHIRLQVHKFLADIINLVDELNRLN